MEISTRVIGLENLPPEVRDQLASSPLGKALGLQSRPLDPWEAECAASQRALTIKTRHAEFDFILATLKRAGEVGRLRPQHVERLVALTETKRAECIEHDDHVDEQIEKMIQLSQTRTSEIIDLEVQNDPEVASMFGPPLDLPAPDPSVLSAATAQPGRKVRVVALDADFPAIWARNHEWKLHHVDPRTAGFQGELHAPASRDGSAWFVVNDATCAVFLLSELAPV